MIFLKQFDELGRDDIDQAGGKGANLGELTRAGLPVPHICGGTSTRGKDRRAGGADG
jgi:phosphoenolpyruvate synthase/pyruvate phosphate dikinase